MDAKRDERARGVWTRQEKDLLRGLDRPERIQAFLNEIPYNADHQCRSPRRVMRDRVAHCMEGALFAAAALRFHGYGCHLLDLQAAGDDDHVIAVYRRHGCLGALAKSNFAGLRCREPVYRTPRELAMSYFNDYFNVERARTLRAFSRLIDLTRFDRLQWMTTAEDLDPIGQVLSRLAHTPLVTPTMIRSFSLVDDRSYQGNLLGANWDGLYKPSGTS